MNPYHNLLSCRPRLTPWAQPIDEHPDVVTFCADVQSVGMGLRGDFGDEPDASQSDNGGGASRTDDCAGRTTP